MGGMLAAVGGFLGGGTVAGDIVTGALIGGGVSAITGGNILNGAVLGAAGGGLYGEIAGTAGGAAGGAAGGSAASTAVDPIAQGLVNASGGTISVAQASTIASAVGPDTAQGLIQSVATGEMPASDLAQMIGNVTTGATTTAAATKGLSALGQKFLGSSVGNGLLSALVNLGGTAYAAQMAEASAAEEAAGYIQAGNILAPAAAQAGELQSNAATTSANTLAAADTAAANQKVAGINQGIGTIQGATAAQAGLQTPYLAAGTDALQTLSAGLAPGGQFNTPFTMAQAQNMPAYQFALQQGEQALQNAAGPTGGAGTTGYDQSLITFAEGTAAQYENQAFQQWLAQNNLTLGGLQNMVSTGQISTQNLSSALQSAGVNVAAAQNAIGVDLGTGTTGAATAQAAGQVGAANATAQGLTGAAGAEAYGTLGAATAGSNSTNIVTQGVSNIANNLAGILPGTNQVTSGYTPIYTMGSANQSAVAPLSAGSTVSNLGTVPQPA